MADTNNGSPLGGLADDLQQGGWKGGIAGALMGVDKSINPQGGVYEKMQNYTQNAQQNKADLQTKYMDLQLKSQTLQENKMKLDVLKKQQSGLLDQAEVQNRLASNMLENIGNLTKSQSTEIIGKMTDSYKQLDDNQRSMVAKFSDEVVDQKTHAQAYNQLDQIAQQMYKKSAEEVFNVSKKWSGEESVNEWMFNKRVSTASTRLLEQERLSAVETKQKQTLMEMGQEFDVENQTRKFIFDAYLQQMDNEKTLSVAKIKALADSDKPMKRSDIQEEPTSAIMGSLVIGLNSILGERADKDAEDEVIKNADKLANEVGKRVDKAWQEYSEGKRERPLTQTEAKEQVLNEFQSTVGTDGKIYQPNDRRLLAQKEQWMNIWKNSVLNDPDNGDDFSSLPDNLQDLYAQSAWGSVKYRGMATAKTDKANIRRK